jgi:hypothetical protein
MGLWEDQRNRVCVARLLGHSGFVDLFKTTSNLYVADGLIFKGLRCYYPIAANHSEIRQWRKPLKISPLLDQGGV